MGKGIPAVEVLVRVANHEAVTKIGGDGRGRGRDVLGRSVMGGGGVTVITVMRSRSVVVVTLVVASIPVQLEVKGQVLLGWMHAEEMGVGGEGGRDVCGRKEGGSAELTSPP